MGEVAISPVGVEEARRPRPRHASEQNVDQSQLMKGVERVERLESREVALDQTARQKAMLAPLYVDRRGTAAAPIRVEYLAVPVRPHVGRCAVGVVADPHDLLVGGDGERDPRAMYVVAPEQVIRDDRTRGMDDSDGALEREPFVALLV